MTDGRPANCRFRLQDEGKAYPRSGCRACGRNIATGLMGRCTMRDKDIPEEVLKHAMRPEQPK